ncbi:MAG: cobalt ECF transporter T component CbiQ [Termitinemataceae bacterium]|nr:MAG: cobalt ECF transporter T component CbiQ [Termitinemataceae bacterium]
MSQFHRAAAGIDHLERLSRRNSVIHSLNTRIKAAAAGFYIVLVVSVPTQQVSALFPFFLYPALLMSLSGTPYRALFSRLLCALPFAIFAGISNLVVMRDIAFTLGTFAVSTGLVSFCSILLKTTLTVLAVMILIATTPFSEISAVLTRSPLFRVFGLQLLLCYRYIFVLLDEAQSMWTAYILRCPQKKSKKSAIKMSDMGSFLGQLLLRSFDKAERVYYAMKCRGFNGIYHSTKTGVGLYRADIFFMITVLVLGFFFRFFNVSLFLGRMF